MLEVLTGSGLAASAGLNAYIPLLVMGLLARYTDVIDLSGGWSWLDNGWCLGLMGLLLAVEVVADKVPIVDHVNDLVQTVIRPTAGGLAFGAGTSTYTVTDASPHSTQWGPVIAGVLIALCVHGVKAASRPVVNATTAGFGAPVASTAEDFSSVALSLLAILAPVLVLVGLLLMIAAAVWVFRRRRRRRQERERYAASEVTQSFG
ncbi:MAG: DUF4126 domain-containing protein [Actinoplanes sp.]